MDSLLELTPLIREGTQNANGTSKSERHFLDFVVDGQSLWEALGERHDMVSILWAECSADETAKAVGRLLLNEKADLPNDRRSFFVCSECGDLGCGAITAGPTKISIGVRAAFSGITLPRSGPLLAWVQLDETGV